MRFSAHHVSHVLSSSACFFLCGPSVSVEVVGGATGDGVVGPLGPVGDGVVGGAPDDGGVVGGMVGGAGGGSLGSRGPGATAPPSFLNRMHARAPSSGRTSGVARSAGSRKDRSRIGEPTRNEGVRRPRPLGTLQKAYPTRPPQATTLFQEKPRLGAFGGASR